MRLSQQSGFTLLEAIVAMVLISGAGMALFSWVNQSLDAIQRVEDVNLRAQAQLAAIEYMQVVNPMERPQGSVNLGVYGLIWDAKPQTEPQDNAAYPRGIGLYSIQMFDTKVAISRGGNAKWESLDMQLVGYKKVRNAGVL